MDVADLGPNAFFTTNGEDVWLLESYYLVPSCTLINLKTRERENFGMRSLTAGKFYKITMPEQALKKED